MVNNMQELKDKMIEKYEQYKKEYKEEPIRVVGFQDCMIELLNLLFKGK